MYEYTWTRRDRRWSIRDCWIDVECAGTPVGNLKIIDFGAIANTFAGPYSFRPGGLDPTAPSFSSYWKREIGHDASVVDLTAKETIGVLSVSPFHNRFSLRDHGLYDWRLSFLGREGRWKREGRVVATIRDSASTSGVGHAIVATPNRGDSTILLFFGLYLFASGRAG